MKRVYAPTNHRRNIPPESHREPPSPFPTSRPFNNFYTHARGESNFTSNHHRPARDLPLRQPNFVVDLRTCRRGLQISDVEFLVYRCKSKPESYVYFPKDFVAVSLYFCQWVEALEAMSSFWELRLNGIHDFTPDVSSKVLLPSDRDELQDRLRAVFADHVKGLMEGEEVKKWLEKSVRVTLDIMKVSALLKKNQRIRMHKELSERKKGLLEEKELIERRVKEFQSAMQCLLYYLQEEKLEVSGQKTVRVFKLSGELDWQNLYNLIMRENRRLEVGLPIYASRQEILQQIHSQQILVLIGETGSGKSTQLVQFLADSGIGATESIICTQPRKIAALSLAHRVAEESSGCYGEDSVTCFATFSSLNQFGSKIIYMTDHCLLQHYMIDKNLSGISCIIIDEAHERSLNTDLLLALIKSLLLRRDDLRVIIMSATADAKQLSNYFFGCEILYVSGRNYPVDVRYVTYHNEGSSASATVASFVFDVVRMAAEIHKTEGDGTILAFLTSQMEVEWACGKFEAPFAIALALHGKLSPEEQFRVFQTYSGKRKVIFATNLAETSLTIPGVKYVIDSGMVKNNKFDPGSGMNVLRVCWISQSSAEQRAGRAGRTEPGRCYRLYSESDYQSMAPNQEPEIHRVHLGVAVLRILALGIKNVQEFDYIDAPSPRAIDLAIRNLVQLGAVKLNNNICELTDEGRYLVKLGVEPKLGKLILNCFHHNMGKEGVVLASLMANASSIFCRVGSEVDKQKSDCLKVQFCHRSGDLFTLLSVYKEWEALPQDRKNKWCWENSINAKSMRRCRDTVLELEMCLQHELNVIIPTLWVWNPHKFTESDKHLMKVILSSLSENVAMFSGYDNLGYEVALSGQHVQLHPSCSLLMFGQKPSWVVFNELLSISNQYLVCVTAFDFESLSTLDPPPLFDVSEMENRKLEVRVLTRFGSALLKRFCGKFNSNLLSLVSRVRDACMDDRIGINVNVDQNDIQLYATSQDMEKVSKFVSNALDCERKWLHNECMEKFLYHGPGVSAPLALFGSGAEIKHLELERRCLSVDVFHSKANPVDDRELLMFLEKTASGSICSIHKISGIGQDAEEREKWGRVTFLSPVAAEKAAELNCGEFCGSLLKVVPSLTTNGADKWFRFPAVRAKIFWPRRVSKGSAIVTCDIHDVDFIVNDFYNLAIGGRRVRCEASNQKMGGVVISGLDKDLSEAEILDVLKTATNQRILDFFLLRGNAVENPPCRACEEALLKEISPFLPKGNPHFSSCQVQVFQPEPKDAYMKALITFDGRLHMEAAKALQQMEGKVLPGFLPWQKIKCQQLFNSSLTFPAAVYDVIKYQLNSLLASFRRLRGAECILDRTANGSYRIKISAKATKTVANIRRPLEELTRGKNVVHRSLTPAVLQLLFSREGISLMRTVQRETHTHILFERHNLNVRVFGSPDKVSLAEQKLIQSLLTLHESKQLEIHLRGRDLPPDLMKQVVKKFGADLNGLKEVVPGAEFTLNTRRQIIILHGNRELKPKVEEKILEIAQSIDHLAETDTHADEAVCPICLCEVEDGFWLEGCGHLFCRLCLVEQCESAIKSQDSFPICCTKEGCRHPILLTDFRSLFLNERLEELFRSSLGAFVASSGGVYRFCPSPDCPSVYRVAKPGAEVEPFLCSACYAETCTSCHLEYHPYLSCERYREFKEDPDSSLREWCKGKEHVKWCPGCGHTIEKVDGCNHVECRCGKHVCWVCLESYGSSDECYSHLRNVHMTII